MSPCQAERRGRWLNDPVLELLPGTRLVRLPEELVYIDRRGRRHVVPAGEVSDGMTSPAWSWGIIGSPLTPDYRRPCFLHDYYVVTLAIPLPEAHQLLKEGLLEARSGRLWRLRVWTFDWLVRRLGPKRKRSAEPCAAA
jgi:hypothetical protein